MTSESPAELDPEEVAAVDAALDSIGAILEPMPLEVRALVLLQLIRETGLIAEATDQEEPA